MCSTESELNGGDIFIKATWTWKCTYVLDSVVLFLKKIKSFRNSETEHDGSCLDESKAKTGTAKVQGWRKAYCLL